MQTIAGQGMGSETSIDVINQNQTYQQLLRIYLDFVHYVYIIKYFIWFQNISSIICQNYFLSSFFCPDCSFAK